MAAPLGNKNATKGRPFARAIERACIQNDGAKLRAIAEKLLDMAAAGDMPAIREVADRLDGGVVKHLDAKLEHRSAETLSEEHARLVAESYLDALRSGSSDGAPEAGGVHASDAAGLPAGGDSPEDSAGS